jgi:hypothetical protein
MTTHRRSVETNTLVPWFMAASAVQRVQSAAEEEGNGLVTRACESLWRADMEQSRAPTAWATVAEFAARMED